MNILRLARVPAITIEADATVVEGIGLMQRENVGCLFVVKNDLLVGVLSERDVMRRVVFSSRDPKTTPIRQVMTMPARQLSRHATIEEAIRTMAVGRVRRLPIVCDSKVEGMVSLRYLLRENILGLTERCDSLIAPYCADGIGG